VSRCGARGWSGVRRRRWSGPASRELRRAGWASPGRNWRRCAGAGAAQEWGAQWAQGRGERVSSSRKRRRKEEEQLRDVQGDGVQGSHARCGRSCSATAAGGFAREQRGRAWRTSEAVEEKAAEGTALMQADHGPRGDRGDGYGAASQKEKLRSDTRRSGQEQRGAGSSRSTRPAAVVDRS
jgi:hypothetical protein